MNPDQSSLIWVQIAARTSADRERADEKSRESREKELNFPTQQTNHQILYAK